jgi:HK97 family phage major capsid protein
MTDEKLKAELFTEIDASIKKNLAEIVSDQVAEKVAETVKKQRLDAKFNGSKVTDEEKLAFARDMQAIATGQKAAYLGSSDQSGGFLLPTEVNAEILRIAATTGIIARDARRWPMTEQTLELPRYTGSVMQGAFQGEDTEGSETQNDLGEAVLEAKYWQVMMRIGNRLLRDASVSLGDWFLTMAGEGYAYKLDREGFAGGTYAGSPFVGLLASSEVTVQTMATGKTGFDKFDFAEATDAIATLPTAALSKGAFYFHRTTWGKIKSKKDSTSGQYEFNQLNAPLMSLMKENGIQPVGMIDGYPVFTTDVLPAFSASTTSTKFGVFANMELALAWGDRGPMEVAKSTDATVGGKSVFAANQSAFRFSNEVALAIQLPAAAVVLKTAAS